MNELIFIVEEAPEGATLLVPSGRRFSLNPTVWPTSMSRFAMLCVAISMKVRALKCFGFTLFERKSLLYEEAAP